MKPLGGERWAKWGVLLAVVALILDYSAFRHSSVLLRELSFGLGFLGGMACIMSLVENRRNVMLTVIAAALCLFVFL